MSVAGFFAGLAKVILGIILGASLLALVITSSFSQVTEYNTLKPLAIEVINSSMGQGFSLNESNFNEFKQMIEFGCVGKDVFEFPSGVNNSMPISIKCNELNNITNAEQFKEIVLGQLIDTVYYADYGCTDIVKCLKSGSQSSQGLSAGPFVIISKTAHDSFAKYAMYSLILVIVCAGLLLLFKPFAASLQGIGISFAIVGVATFFIPSITKFALTKIPPESQQYVSSIATKIFNIVQKNFLTVFIIGVALIVAGIILGIIFKEKKPEKK
jgi:hypothetical protein